MIIKALGYYDMFKVLNTHYSNFSKDEMFVDTEKANDDWGGFPDLYKLGWVITAFRATQRFIHKGKWVDGSRLWLEKISVITAKSQKY